MHIDIIIPTYDRLSLLKETISSIRNSTYKDKTIIVVIDGNPGLAVSLAGLPVMLIINRKRIDWVRSMNKAISLTHGSAVIYASDDLVFSPDCIEQAVKRMPEDQDALVAIEQDVKGCSTAFGLLGRKFIDRFPKGQVFCPDYIHFGSDFELGRFASSIGKLILCPEAKVKHHRRHDDTHKLAKAQEPQDFFYIKERRSRGLLWGKSFELLRGKIK